MWLTDTLLHRAEYFPDELAAVGDGTRLTNRDLLQRSNRLGSALWTQGVRKGDRVAIFSGNSPEMFETFFATSRIGAIAVPLNYRLSPRELRYILDNCGAETLIVEPSLYGQIAPALADVHVKRLLSYGPGVEGASVVEDLMREAKLEPPAVDLGPEDRFTILYTSGTTGDPKGAVLTHLVPKEMFLLVRPEYRSLPPAPVFYNCLPLFHIALTMATTYWAGGFTLVFSRDWSPDVFLKTLQAEQVTHCLAAPVMILMSLDNVNMGKGDLSKLQEIAYGAAPMPPEPLRKAMAAFGCGFRQWYGMTESGGPVTTLPPEFHNPEGDAQALHQLSSAGRPMSGVQIRIADALDQPLPAGELGEIQIKAACCMEGYWNLPEVTAETMKSGWLHTGDIARRGEEGFLYIVDRKRDMIITGGENVFPIEVENALYGHPAIREVAVIGVPHEVWGEEVMAIVVLKEGHQLTIDELTAHCADRLASYKRPRRVEFVEALPRNAAGKVLKKMLREPYWAGEMRRVH